MKVQSKLELEFAGLTLAVVQDETGQDVVAVKPIIEALGVDWMTQYRRMQTPYLSRRLGVCIGKLLYAGQAREMVCIRVDRVAALLSQINPEAVRGQGNALAADFLETKQCEWDDVLHEYETRKGGLLSSATRERSVNVRLFLAVLKEKRTSKDDIDRQALGSIAQQMAGDLGIPYEAVPGK